MNLPELPPLPEAQDDIDTGSGREDVYTANQMRAYAAQAVAAERERAALCCDDLAWMMENGAGDPEPGGRLRQAARNIRDGGKPMRLDQYSPDADLDCIEARKIDRAYAICEPCNTGHPENCLYKREAAATPG